MFLTTFFMFCVVPQVVRASDSEFTAAVYEHPFPSLKNKTNIPSRQEALGIVMDNMNVYEQQIRNAKRKVGVILDNRQMVDWYRGTSVC